MFWRCGCLCSLVALLVACAPLLPTPQPTVSPVYLPLVLRNYPRPVRGVAGGLWGMDADAFYHWTISPYQMDEGFARMVWCLADYHEALFEPQVVIAAQRDYAAGIRGRVWLVLNEPDDSGGRVIGGQCGAYPLTGNPFDPANYAPTIYEAPVATAIRYSAMYDLIKAHDPHARIFTGGMGWIGHTISRDWWTRFVGELQRRGELWKVEGVHVHAYPFGSFPTWGLDAMYAGLREWYADYHVGLGLGDRPIWITETGGGSCSRWQRWDPAAYHQIRERTMLPMLAWFDGPQNPGYAAVFWFVSWDGTDAEWWCNYLVDNRTLPTQVTPLGVTWLTK